MTHGLDRLAKDLKSADSERAEVHAADRRNYRLQPTKSTKTDNLRPIARTWVVLADIHYPEHDPDSLTAVFDFIQKTKPYGVVLLGDNLDCQSISRHTEGLPGLRKEGSFQEDLIGFDAKIMSPIERMVPNVKKVWFEGNHEAWLTRFLEKEPQFKGALSFPRLLRLVERGWKFVPQGERYYIGKLGLLHGDSIGSATHVAKKLVDTQCRNSMMGHVHTYSTFTKTSESNEQDKWVGYTLPCLSNTNPKYGKGRPNSHIHGFGIVEEWSNGYVNVYVPIVMRGRFSFGGRLYGG